MGLDPSFSSRVGVMLPSSLVGVLSPASPVLNAFIKDPFAPAAKSGSPCSEKEQTQ